MEKTKKSEISTATLIIFILLVVGFGILIWFLYQFYLSENIDKETCHQSVIFRATGSQVSGALESFVPLKCKTAKYCLTTRTFGWECDDFSSAEKKEVTKVKISKGIDGVKDIERFMAQEIVDCWSMMGEGKVSLFSKYIAKNYGIGNVAPTCVLCSRIAFDKKVLEEDKVDLGLMDLRKYMYSYKMQNKDVTYFEYLSGEKGQVSIKTPTEFTVPPAEYLDPKDKTSAETDEKLDKLKFDEEKNKQAKEMAIFFMQISAPDPGEAAANVLGFLGITTLGSFILAPVTTTKIALGAVSSKVFWAAAAIFGIYQQVNIAYNRAVTAGYCGDVSLGKDARAGCSVVRTTNYDADDIKQYCSYIESIP